AVRRTSWPTSAAGASVTSVKEGGGAAAARVAALRALMLARVRRNRMRFMAATVSRRSTLRIGDFPTCVPDGRKDDQPASDSAVTVLTNVIGRTTELAAIDDFLDSLEDGPAALVLEGDRGIGKTTLV